MGGNLIRDHFPKENHRSRQRLDFDSNPPLLLPHAASFAPLQTALLPSKLRFHGEKQQPVWVLYCGVCSFPAEYREFGPDFEKCKFWLRQNVPDAREKEADKAAEQLQAVGISGGGGGETSGPNAGGASASKQEEIKRLPGGKTKKKEKQEVVIEKIVRNKRKYVTVVEGLDLFGIKLSDASKEFATCNAEKTTIGGGGFTRAEVLQHS
ncbi:translation machinery-associated protein 22-like [Typha angustifolia]|uniref:translation machinery-associated protein 22-like n=1 Tax=Typha angustifolia TaxID=59011 RepID=UPI003C30D79E